MAFNIDNFVNNGLRHGGARPTLFDVVVTFPAALQGVPSGAVEKLRFTARATSIPASSVASVDVPYFGRNVKVAGDRTFTDWSVTIMNDEDYSVRNAMEAWHNNVNTIVSNRRIVADNPRGGYKGTATVRQYSKRGTQGGDNDFIKAYTFVNIFPVVVDEMGLDWEAQNQIQTFGVTFAYDYWVPLMNNIGLEGGPTSPQINVTA
jgi:hypothetical protein